MTDILLFILYITINIPEFSALRGQLINGTLVNMDIVVQVLCTLRTVLEDAVLSVAVSKQFENIFLYCAV